jgi:sugar phosphate permease
VSSEAPEPHALQKTWRRRAFASTWVCYAGYYFCRKAWGIVSAAVGEAHGLDASTLGWIATSFIVAYTVGQFISGWMGQRLGARRLLLGGMALSILAHGALGFANSTSTFVVFMVVNGLAQSTGWCATVATMARWFHRSERGFVMGFWATCYQVGGVLAKGLAAWSIGALGYRYAFFTGSLVVVGVWVVVYFYQRNGPSDVGLDELEDFQEGAQVAPEAGSTWDRSTLTSVLLVGVFYFFVKFIRYAIDYWVPYLFHHHFGLDFAEAGYLSLLFDLFGVGGVIAIGYASDKWFSGRRARISLLAVVGMVGACFVLATGGGESVALFAFALGLVGFTLYGPDALMSGAAAIDIGTPRQAALAAGIINGMGSVGGALQGPVIGSLLDDPGGATERVLWLLVAASVAAAATLGVVVWRNHKGWSDV